MCEVESSFIHSFESEFLDASFTAPKYVFVLMMIIAVKMSLFFKTSSSTELGKWSRRIIWYLPLKNFWKLTSSKMLQDNRTRNAPPLRPLCAFKILSG